MHYEDFKRKPHNWGLPENEIWRRYQLFMEQEMFMHLHLQILEAKGQSESDGSFSSSGGASVGDQEYTPGSGWAQWNNEPWSTLETPWLELI